MSADPTTEGLEKAKRIWELEALERELAVRLEEADRERRRAQAAYWGIRCALLDAKLERLQLEGWEELELLLTTEAELQGVKHWKIADAGIVNIDVLCACSRADLLAIRGIGPLSVDAIERSLAMRGLALRTAYRCDS